MQFPEERTEALAERLDQLERAQRRSRYTAAAFGLIVVAVITSAVVVPSQQSGSPLPPQRNLIGNGGFEIWSLGEDSYGKTPPTGWFPSGNALLFEQTELVIRRRETDTGEVFVALESIKAEGYLAQQLCSSCEFQGARLVFSLDLRTDSQIARPQLAIAADDELIGQVRRELPKGPNWIRLTATAVVPEDAEEVELRIYPGGAVDVDRAMALVGAASEAAYVPQRNPEPGLGELPIGTVIDWYRADAEIPIPAGFAIADGSTVSDPLSPLRGMQLPNLDGMFVRGVIDPTATGERGGQEEWTGQHAHSIDHSHDATTAPARERETRVGSDRGRGVPSNHTHRVVVEQFVGFSALETLTVPTVPPYVGLLKIVKLR